MNLTNNHLPIVVAEPLPLMDICRRTIRHQLGKNRLHEIPRLPLPNPLKSYLLYQS